MMIERKETKKIRKTFKFKNGEESSELYLGSDVIFLADVFEKFINASINEYAINPLYCVTLPGYTYQCGLKYADNKIKTLQDKSLILLHENNIRGSISCVMGEKFVKSYVTKRILNVGAKFIYGHSMSQPKSN